jgi:hypothetical protein
MLCYSCERVASCPTFQTLDAMSKDFEIKDCRDYKKNSAVKYKLIAQDDELMRFFYDYFTDNLDEHLQMVEDEEIRIAIKHRLLKL